MMVSGWISDKMGAKLSYSIAMVWWSVAEMGHALARTPVAFGIGRIFLGAGEAVYFPASMKAISQWFPKRESALPTGLLNGAVTLGAVVSPIVILFINKQCGWRVTFIATGTLGLIPLAGWLALYERPDAHPRLTAEERELITGGTAVPNTTNVSWIRLLGH